MKVIPETLRKNYIQYLRFYGIQRWLFGWLILFDSLPL